MTRLAKSVQFPISCPECNANTAHSLADLAENPEVACRHCNHQFTISDVVQRRISRAMSDITGYIDMPEQEEVELLEEEAVAER